MCPLWHHLSSWCQRPRGISWLGPLVSLAVTSTMTNALWWTWHGIWRTSHVITTPIHASRISLSIVPSFLWSPWTASQTTHYSPWLLYSNFGVFLFHTNRVTLCTTWSSDHWEAFPLSVFFVCKTIFEWGYCVWHCFHQSVYICVMNLAIVGQLLFQNSPRGP